MKFHRGWQFFMASICDLIYGQNKLTLNVNKPIEIKHNILCKFHKRWRRGKSF